MATIKPLKPAAELPETVNVLFKRNTEKYLHLRQSIANGSIEGHEIKCSYSLHDGSCIVEIGGHTYQAPMGEIIQQIFHQLVL